MRSNSFLGRRISLSLLHGDKDIKEVVGNIISSGALRGVGGVGVSIRFGASFVIIRGSMDSYGSGEWPSLIESWLFCPRERFCSLLWVMLAYSEALFC